MEEDRLSSWWGESIDGVDKKLHPRALQEYGFHATLYKCEKLTGGETLYAYGRLVQFDSADKSKEHERHAQFVGRYKAKRARVVPFSIEVTRT